MCVGREREREEGDVCEVTGGRAEEIMNNVCRTWRWSNLLIPRVMIFVSMYLELLTKCLPYCYVAGLLPESWMY